MRNAIRLFLVFVVVSPAQAALQVSPPSILLDNPEATQQILVRSANSPADLTRLATYEIADPKIAAVDATGLVQPKAEGRTVLVIRHGQDQDPGSR